MALRNHANETGDILYRDEDDSVEAKRKEAISCWMERNANSILADDAISMYRTWSVDLMDELDEIDREAIQRERRKYVALLTEAEKKMQTLVAFWTDCGLVSGQRTPPSSWWEDPKEERLDAINTKFAYHSDKAEKLRVITNGDSEPAASDSLPQSMPDELDIVWHDRHRLDHNDTNEMIVKIFQQRKSKHHQCLEEGPHTSPQPGSDISSEEPAQMAHSPVCSGQKNLSQYSATGAATTPEEALQLREKPSRRARCRPNMKTTMAEDHATWQGRLRSQTNTMIPESQMIWQNRLRPRQSTISASRKQVQRPTGMPKGIVKQYSWGAPAQKRQIATKDQATSITQKAGASYLCDTNSRLIKAPLQSTPAIVVRARRTKNARQQVTHETSTVRREAVKKIYNTKERRAHRLMTTLNNKS